MKFKDLCSEIAKREGKKSQVSIGNIREILSILIDIQAEAWEEPIAVADEPLMVLVRMAKQRSRDNAKKKAMPKKTKG